MSMKKSPDTAVHGSALARIPRDVHALQSSRKPLKTFALAHWHRIIGISICISIYFDMAVPESSVAPCVIARESCDRSHPPEICYAQKWPRQHRQDQRSERRTRLSQNSHW